MYYVAVYVGFCLAILIASEIKVGQVHEGEVFELREEKENQKHEGNYVI